MNRHFSLMLIGLATVLSGCTLAPKYNRLAAPVPDEWPKGAAYAEMPAGTDTPAAADLA